MGCGVLGIVFVMNVKKTGEEKGEQGCAKRRRAVVSRGESESASWLCRGKERFAGGDLEN